jgi:hypothetical protein
MATLDQAEKDLLDSVESGEWQSIPNTLEAAQRYQSHAQKQVGLWAEVQNELSNQDLQVLESLANQMETSVPRLLVNIIHQYLAQQSPSS